MAKIRAAIAGPYVEAFLVNGYNGRLLIPAGDLQIGRSLAFCGHWERDTIEFLDSYLHESSEVLVVGAHVGSLVIPIARRVKRVVGLEPNPKILDLLKMNLKLNDISNVECFDFAAGESDSTVEFLLSSYNSGTSKVKRGALQALPYNVGRYDSIQVGSRRLDDAFRDCRFDLIVMDVEGSETAALAGMPVLLERANFLMLEVMPAHIRHLAGVSAEEFFRPVARVFNRAILCGESSVRKEFCGQDFPLLFDAAADGFKDALFYRA